MRFLNLKLNHFLIIILFTGGLFSCDKNELVPIGEITGPSSVCYVQKGVQYSIPSSSDAEQIIWTVPHQAQIISGQGTNVIVVDFGRHAGTICAQFYSKGLQNSIESCMEVTFNNIPNHWCRSLDFKGGDRRAAVGFSINGKGYVGTGFSDYPIKMHQDFWEFDPDLNTWTQKTDFGGGARVDAVGFSIGSKGYIGTGVSNFGIAFNDFWEYDPAQNLWTEKAVCPGPARQYAFGFSIADKGYIGSGSKNFTGGLNALLSDFYEYDPAQDVWVEKDTIIPRLKGSGFSIENRGYLALGEISSAKFKDLWEYDPFSGNWTQKEDFPGIARKGAVAFSIANKGYIGTGQDGNGFSHKDFYEYDPNLNSWLALPDVGGKIRNGAIGFSIGNRGFIGTGDKEAPEQQNLKDFWVYTP